MTTEEFILANADPIWLHQNEMWEYMPESRDELAEAMRADREDETSP